jgi:osmotically-inducible protein OsmY
MGADYRANGEETSDKRASRDTKASGDATSRSNAAVNEAERSHDEPAQPTPAADNTKVNKRDRSDGAVTPMDQGSSEADRRITQQIRQALMKDGALSFTAKNVKIITNNGRVVLRGSVKSDAERSAIEADAQKVAGKSQVENQIEVAK